MHKPKERVRQKYKVITEDYNTEKNREMIGSTVSCRSRNHLRHRSETVATALEVVAELTLVENN